MSKWNDASSANERSVVTAAELGSRDVTEGVASRSRFPDPITAEQRAAAARIRVAYDKKRGRKTEAWIQRLAG